LGDGSSTRLMLGEFLPARLFGGRPAGDAQQVAAENSCTRRSGNCKCQKTKQLSAVLFREQATDF